MVAPRSREGRSLGYYQPCPYATSRTKRTRRQHAGSVVAQTPVTLELSTVTLCFLYKAAVSSRTSKRPPAGTPPKLRKVTSIATCRSPSSMQAERVLPVTQFKPTRLRLSLRLFLTTATCSAFASLKRKPRSGENCPRLK
jgi:hypothetical protein